MHHFQWHFVILWIRTPSNWENCQRFVVKICAFHWPWSQNKTYSLYSNIVNIWCLNFSYLFCVVQKASHLVMPCLMAPICSHWAYSAFFSWDMKAVSCSLQWSVCSMKIFRSCVSYSKMTNCVISIRVHKQARILTENHLCLLEFLHRATHKTFRSQGCTFEVM